MLLVEPISRKRLCVIFCAVVPDVSAGLSSIRVTAVNGHWTTGTVFCQQVALDPLLHLYTDPIPILQTFAGEYRVGDIVPRHRPVRSHTVEDAIRSIG